MSEWEDEQTHLLFEVQNSKLSIEFSFSAVVGFCGVDFIVKIAEVLSFAVDEDSGAPFLIGRRIELFFKLVCERFYMFFRILLAGKDFLGFLLGMSGWFNQYQ